MRRSAHSDDDIRAFVQDLIGGRPADEICRIADVSERTLYRWRRKFGGLKPFAVQALRQLEQENRRLRHEAARQAGRAADEAPAAAAQPLVRSDLGRPLTGAAQPAVVVGRYAALRIR